MTNNKVIKLVDKMLSDKSSFEDIMRVTGWSMDEIWIYMDMVFRLNNPDFGKSNKHYCVWGMDDDKLVKTR